MNKQTIITALLTLVAFTAEAQEKIVDSWIYAEALLSSDSVSQIVKSMVDTGCSVCVIDSAYAADAFGLGAERYTVKFKNKRNMIVMDSVRFCGQTYRDVLCIVSNLQRVLVDYAPRFVVGGNILNTGAWKFNLASRTVEPYDVSRKTTGTVVRWKMLKKFLNFIVLKGKVNGKRVSFMFDTGARRCKLPKGFDAGPTETVMKERASIVHQLKWENVELSRDVRFKIGKNEFIHDFYHDNEYEYGLLNATIFGGRSFVLNYMNKTIEIFNDK